MSAALCSQSCSNCTKVAQMHFGHLMRQVPKLMWWGAPAVLAAGWFIFPAVPDRFKPSFASSAAPLPIAATKKTIRYFYETMDTMPKVVEDDE